MRDTHSVDASRGRILLVDDNPTNLSVLHDTLRGRGYEIRVARSGEQALQVAAKNRPDLVLLDIMMPPGIDGFETLRRLKDAPDTRDASVIFLSALDDTADRVKGLELGAVDYIGKPFKAEEVIARVNTHLTLQRLRQEIEAANRRMRRDLQAAALVQRSMLPTVPPADDRVRVGWIYEPCDELGGDSFGVHRLGPHHLGIYIVDVSGHGVPSALLAVSICRSLAPSADPSCVVTTPDGGITDPADLALRLNRLYPAEHQGGRYFTMAYAILDLESARLRMVTAGHPGPIVIRNGTPVAHHVEQSLPVGLLDGVTFAASDVALQPGDRLYLFSDGAYEDTNAADEPFGVERLTQTFIDGAAHPLEATLTQARDAACTWSATARLTDDFTIIGLEVLKTGR